MPQNKAVLVTELCNYLETALLEGICIYILCYGEIIIELVIINQGFLRMQFFRMIHIFFLLFRTIYTFSCTCAAVHLNPHAYVIPSLNTFTISSVIQIRRHLYLDYFTVLTRICTQLFAVLADVSTGRI